MMRLALLTGAGVMALGSTLVMAQDSPTDLLPPGFGDPAPASTPTPEPAQPAVPDQPVAPDGPGTSGSVQTVQPLPQVPQISADPSLDISGLPSVEELEAMSEDDLDDLLGLKPRYDIPPAARRTLERVGIIDVSEGGQPEKSLSRQPASLVRAAISGTQRPLVSRWGHILLRRTLASRLDAPQGMNPVEFTALRAGLLNRIGEHGVARALVQDVDTGNYDDALLDAALEAYIGTADLVGACPAVRLSETDRDDSNWKLLKGICAAYAGEASRAARDLRRLTANEEVAEIDGLLARRYAGAAGLGRRAVNVEWDGVEDITPMRFALANALREDIPESLLDNVGPYYRNALATAPMMPLGQRAIAAQSAGAHGILSASAMVDIYSQVFATGEGESEAAVTASRLRAAYVDGDPADRLAAINDVWQGDDATLYGRQVLTAYAAARLPVSQDFVDDAPALIMSMLAAGLDRDAMRWASIVPQGSAAWGMLAVAQQSRSQPVSDGQMASFLDQDDSADQHQSRMLLAGLTAMGRLADSEINEYSRRLNVDLTRSTRWTRAISAAADAGNPTLVSLLTGLGMQGNGWDKMTALHLYHIVRALERVGLDAEARMIAAEAVARTA